MANLRVLVTGASLAEQAKSVLHAIGAEVVTMKEGTDQDALVAGLAVAPTQAILMRGNPSLSGSVMDAAPDLRVISKHGVGVNSVDLVAAKARRIRVMVAGDANAPAVAEHTLALIFALGRDVVALSERTRRGHWDRAEYKGREIAGRCLGLVGFGRIARRVAAGARGLGMDVLALPHRPGNIDPALAWEAASLTALLSEADIVSLHVPLTAETTGMIGTDELAAMRPGGLLVNTARGALLDEAAVIASLESGHLGGAALDTLVEEPPRPGNRLLMAPRVIVTPHIASATEAGLIRMGVTAAENIAAVLTGGLLDKSNIVT